MSKRCLLLLLIVPHAHQSTLFKAFWTHYVCLRFLITYIYTVTWTIITSDCYHLRLLLSYCHRHHHHSGSPLAPVPPVVLHHNLPERMNSQSQDLLSFSSRIWNFYLHPTRWICPKVEDLDIGLLHLSSHLRVLCVHSSSSCLNDRSLFYLRTRPIPPPK